MSWSTRQLAELAGTTLRAVRHYHEVGLLEEPQRRSNGYKRYGVAHLVRVMRIKRLVDLGFSLSQVAEMGDSDDHPEDALRTLDAELAASIERLQRARVELRLLRRHSAPTDLPPDFALATSERELSEVDRSFTAVMSRTLGPETREAFTDLLRTGTDDPAATEFDELPADADESTRQNLALRLADYVRTLYQADPRLRDFTGDAPKGRRFAAETIGIALVDLYNPAQVDVINRMAPLLTEPDQGGPA